MKNTTAWMRHHLSIFCWLVLKIVSFTSSYAFYNALSIVYHSYHIKGLKLLYLSFVWDIIEWSWSSSFCPAPPNFFFLDPPLLGRIILQDDLIYPLLHVQHLSWGEGVILIQARWIHSYQGFDLVWVYKEL